MKDAPVQTAKKKKKSKRHPSTQPSTSSAAMEVDSE
jgi:hypothetical protein